MHTAQFENWLREVAGLSAGTVGSRLNNCKRLERYEGDLDEHFDADGMAILLARLTYSTTDERQGVPTLHRVPIDGNRRTGTATLKSAAVLYKQFRESHAAPFAHQTHETFRRRPRSPWDRDSLFETDGRMEMFESWLLERTQLSTGSVGSYVANCKRLERYEGNLDDHFNRDRMASLLARLTYSTADERYGVWPRHDVPISGNLRDGTATLKSSATLYGYFLQNVLGDSEPATRPTRPTVESNDTSRSRPAPAHGRDSEYESQREYWWHRIINRKSRDKQRQDPILDDYDDLENAEALTEQVLMARMAGQRSKTRKWTSDRARHRHAGARGREESWPNWEYPRDEQILSLAKVLTPFIRFLRPDIVAAVADDNRQRSSEWRDKFNDFGIEPDVYLWDGSPCAFPGIRRYAGSNEIAWFRKRIASDEYTPPDCLDLDDNDFPKHLWAFVFTGRPFRKKGPPDYRLAHLADHKDHNNRWREQFDVELGAIAEPPPLYGLFTSPANAVYLPSNFLTPTDFSESLRQLILQQAYLLYGSVCRPAPPPLVAKKKPDSAWNPKHFEWGQPVGTTSNLPRFLEWRSAEIDKAFAKRWGI